MAAFDVTPEADLRRRYCRLILLLKGPPRLRFPPVLLAERPAGFISVELVDFDEDEDQLAILSDHLVGTEPITARLTYVFQKAERVKGDPKKESDYEFVCFGGDRPDNEFGYDVRSRIPLALLPALRDAENDIANWRRSPLRPLLDRATVNIDRSALEKVAEDVAAAGAKLGGIPEIKQAAGAVNSRLERMVGDYYSADILLGLAPSDADRLIRALRVFIDDGKRSISDASLGTANLLYLSLKALEFERLTLPCPFRARRKSRKTNR